MPAGIKVKIVRSLMFLIVTVTFLSGLVIFQGYVDFFLLQDFVDDEYQVNILTDFDDFQSSPLPQTVEQYTAYLQGLTEVLTLRAKRIERYIN